MDLVRLWPRWRSAALVPLALLALALAGCDGGSDGPSRPAPEQIVTLPSGLRYAILRQGSGPAAGEQAVLVHYTGWLQESGTKFDSSHDRGQPFSFSIGAREVIRGWEEGVKGMRIGEKRQLIVPAALGYGARGQGEIPPNSTLIFEVELVDIPAGG